MVFHGQGGYDYNTIYNMPIWLRNFTFNKIKAHVKDGDIKNREVDLLVRKLMREHNEC